MSGYNRKTGYFNMTQTQAAYWLRRDDIPEECRNKEGLDLACCVLEHHRIRVVENHGSWAEIDATNAEIWEALSGQPSDPERAAYHDKGRFGN